MYKKILENIEKGKCDEAETQYKAYKIQKWNKYIDEIEQKIRKCKEEPLNVNTNNTNCTCHGGKNGTIVVSANGGKPFDGGKYRFRFASQEWTDPKISHKYQGLAKGDYKICVKDAEGNEVCKSVSIKEPDAISVTSTVTGATIIVRASGGRPFGENEYKFSINGGKEYQRSKECWFTDLQNGSYSIRVKDASGCVSTVKAEVKQTGNNSTDPPSQQGNNKSKTQSTDSVGKYVSIIIERSGCCNCDDLRATAKVVNHNDCIGCSEGQIQVTVDNSYDGKKYKFSCDGGENWIESTSPYIFRNLKTGSYHIKVKDTRDETDCGTMKVTGPVITRGSLHGHDWVDLGLPSGTRWATCNVGANSPTDYGNYYAWGETSTKTTYDWSTYRYCNGDYDKLTKYCSESEYGNNGFTDNLTTLQSSDDAATANWGKGWRMPTGVEFEELTNNCTITWTTQKGVNGRLFTGPNGNSIFLPAAGYRLDSSLYGGGSYGLYWSSSLDTGDPINPWHLLFYSDDCDVYGFYRISGLSVRPVCVSAQN